MKDQQLPHDLARMVDGLLGHVWPGGTKKPALLDPLPLRISRPALIIEGSAEPITGELSTGEKP